MLLEQLVKLGERLEGQTADRGDQGLPFMYQEGPVRWMIHLRPDGTFERVVGTSDESGKKNDRGKKYATPHVVRTVAVVPKLLADNAEYVLGIPSAKERSAKKDPAKAARGRHEAFLAELVACEEATGLEPVRAVRRYLERLPDAPFEPPESFSAEDIVSFTVSDVRLFELPEVQAYWASKFSSKPVGEDGSSPGRLVTECLISGVVGPVMDREPVKIKGIPNGQTVGMNIISANAGAFESYGLSGSQIAPVRLELAEKYANTLNTLLRDSSVSMRVGPVVYAFWTRSGPTPPVVEALTRPRGNPRIAALRRGEKPAPLRAEARAEQGAERLKGAFSGRVFEGLEPDAFYGVALSASGGRVVVREHISTTTTAMDSALADFFAAQNVVGCEPYGLFELAASLYRDANKELVPAVPTALLGFALRRTPLPWVWLQKLAARNRAEAGPTRPRVVATKLVLVSNRRIGMEELERLAPGHPDPGYQLGRLLSALEGLQYDALGDLNTTIVDRYWGSLSSTPVVALPRLMAGAQSHLAKLRKDPSSRGGAVANDRLIQDITGRLAGVPTTLPLESQALFGLGYYHQRAERFGRIEAARANKASKGAPRPDASATPLFDANEPSSDTDTGGQP